MYKKIICTILCMLLLAAHFPTVFAEESEAATEPLNIEIWTTEEFLTFAENCRLDSYSRNLIVQLKTDVDLSGTEFQGIPIFCGTFYGNGHKIYGLALTQSGSNLGLFRYTSDSARISNLKVEGNILPSGSKSTIGGIVGYNAGTIENCSFQGTISGIDEVGGIVGSNGVSGRISSCTVSGNISGKHFTGGIAGKNSGVVYLCINHAQVNTTSHQNNVSLTDITIDNMMGTEASSTVTDIGGIAGTSGGVIRSCINHGDVGYQSMGYNIGGIAGSQMGYITDCTNYGEIQGRKEVGGIVGQMEPVTNIAYTEDTLQILQGQLNSMSALANRASAHAQSGMSEASWYISGMQDNIGTAQEAINVILPGLDGEVADPDAIIAATSALNSSMQDLGVNVSGMASSISGTVSAISSDMNAIAGQIGAMQKTINEASENIGGTITDISDADTPENLIGKVSHCTNYGNVFSDHNGGGIAGAMTIENDYDLEEDIQFTGEDSMNFDSELRAVILSCRNVAPVHVGKLNAGGIVGWMPMGLVRDCINTGDIEASAADYAGGIAGQSTGFIRSSYVKCKVSGDTYIGGIAGQADTVTDCCSITMLTGTERVGAVIGYAEISPQEINPIQEKTANEEEEEAEPPIFNNLYTLVDADIGAVDGISYDSIAYPIPMKDFLSMELVPEELKHFTVRFHFDDGTEKIMEVDPGYVLKAADIPELPTQNGRIGQWTCEEGDVISFDIRFTAEYSPLTIVLSSQETDASDRPVMLVTGSFIPEAVIKLQETEHIPVLEDRNTLLESVQITIPESEEPVSIHYLIPNDADADHLTVLVRNQEDQWDTVPFQLSGSYLIFQGQSGTWEYAFVRQQAVSIPLTYALIAGLILTTALITLYIKRRKKSK